MPKNIDDGTGIDSVRGGVGQGKMRLNGREDSKLNYQVRVAVIWIEKVKLMGPCTLDGVGGRRGCAEDRVILADMSNVGMFERVDCHELAFFTFFSPYFSQHLRSLSFKILSHQATYTRFNPFCLLTLFIGKSKRVY